MTEQKIVHILDSSVLVRTLERAGRWIHRSAQTSSLITGAAKSSRVLANQIGVVLMAATVTHVALMLTTRPVTWSWLIVPAMVATISWAMHAD